MQTKKIFFLMFWHCLPYQNAKTSKKKKRGGEPWWLKKGLKRLPPMQEAGSIPGVEDP